MPARKKELDFDLFRKCVRHFDNPNTNERDAFILQALKQCDESGVLFCDAVKQAFGGTDDELRERCESLEAENARLREGVTALNEELAAAQDAETRQRRRGRGFSGLVGEAWSMSQFRLALLVGLIGLRLWLFLLWGKLPWWANLLSVALMLTTFVKWSGRQYEQSGLGAVLMKLTVFGGGLWLSFASFFGDGFWLLWFRRSGADANPWGGFALLLAMLLLTLSKLPERLADLAANSDMGMFRVLRWWFA